MSYKACIAPTTEWERAYVYEPTQKRVRQEIAQLASAIDKGTGHAGPPPPVSLEVLASHLEAEGVVPRTPQQQPASPHSAPSDDPTITHTTMPRESALIAEAKKRITVYHQARESLAVMHQLLNLDPSTLQSLANDPPQVSASVTSKAMAAQRLCTPGGTDRRILEASKKQRAQAIRRLKDDAKAAESRRDQLVKGMKSPEAPPAKHAPTAMPPAIDHYMSSDGSETISPQIPVSESPAGDDDRDREEEGEPNHHETDDDDDDDDAGPTRWEMASGTGQGGIALRDMEAVEEILSRDPEYKTQTRALIATSLDARAQELAVIHELLHTFHDAQSNRSHELGTLSAQRTEEISEVSALIDAVVMQRGKDQAEYAAELRTKIATVPPSSIPVPAAVRNAMIFKKDVACGPDEVAFCGGDPLSFSGRGEEGEPLCLTGSEVIVSAAGSGYFVGLAPTLSSPALVSIEPPVSAVRRMSNVSTYSFATATNVHPSPQDLTLLTPLMHRGAQPHRAHNNVAHVPELAPLSLGVTTSSSAAGGPTISNAARVQGGSPGAAPQQALLAATTSEPPFPSFLHVPDAIIAAIVHGGEPPRRPAQPASRKSDAAMSPKPASLEVTSGIKSLDLIGMGTGSPGVSSLQPPSMEPISSPRQASISLTTTSQDVVFLVRGRFGDGDSMLRRLWTRDPVGYASITSQCSRCLLQAAAKRKGFISSNSREEGFLAGFACPADAFMFVYELDSLLMQSRWDSTVKAFTDCCTLTEADAMQSAGIEATDGSSSLDTTSSSQQQGRGGEQRRDRKLIFNGPRLAAVLRMCRVSNHSKGRLRCDYDPALNKFEYLGFDTLLLTELLTFARGGELLVDRYTWHAVLMRPAVSMTLAAGADLVETAFGVTQLELDSVFPQIAMMGLARRLASTATALPNGASTGATSGTAAVRFSHYLSILRVFPFELRLRASVLGNPVRYLGGRTLVQPAIVASVHHSGKTHVQAPPSHRNQHPHHQRTSQKLNPTTGAADSPSHDVQPQLRWDDVDVPGDEDADAAWLRRLAIAPAARQPSPSDVTSATNGFPPASIFPASPTAALSFRGLNRSLANNNGSPPTRRETSVARSNSVAESFAADGAKSDVPSVPAVLLNIPETLHVASFRRGAETSESQLSVVVVSLPFLAAILQQPFGMACYTKYLETMWITAHHVAASPLPPSPGTATATVLSPSAPTASPTAAAVVGGRVHVNLLTHPQPFQSPAYSKSITSDPAEARVLLADLTPHDSVWLFREPSSAALFALLLQNNFSGEAVAWPAEIDDFYRSPPLLQWLWKHQPSSVRNGSSMTVEAVASPRRSSQAVAATTALAAYPTGYNHANQKGLRIAVGVASGQVSALRHSQTGLMLYDGAAVQTARALAQFARPGESLIGTEDRSRLINAKGAAMPLPILDTHYHTVSVSPAGAPVHLKFFALVSTALRDRQAVMGEMDSKRLDQLVAALTAVTGRASSPTGNGGQSTTAAGATKNARKDTQTLVWGGVKATDAATRHEFITVLKSLCGYGVAVGGVSAFDAAYDTLLGPTSNTPTAALDAILAVMRTASRIGLVHGSVLGGPSVGSGGSSVFAIGQPGTDAIRTSISLFLPSLVGTSSSDAFSMGRVDASVQTESNYLITSVPAVSEGGGVLLPSIFLSKSAGGHKEGDKRHPAASIATASATTVSGGKSPNVTSKGLVSPSKRKSIAKGGGAVGGGPRGHSANATVKNKPSTELVQQPQQHVDVSNFAAAAERSPKAESIDPAPAALPALVAGGCKAPQTTLGLLPLSIMSSDALSASSVGSTALPSAFSPKECLNSPTAATNSSDNGSHPRSTASPTNEAEDEVGSDDDPHPMSGNVPLAAFAEVSTKLRELKREREEWKREVEASRVELKLSRRQKKDMDEEIRQLKKRLNGSASQDAGVQTSVDAFFLLSAESKKEFSDLSIQVEPLSAATLDSSMQTAWTLVPNGPDVIASRSTEMTPVPVLASANVGTTPATDGLLIRSAQSRALSNIGGLSTPSGVQLMIAEETARLMQGLHIPSAAQTPRQAQLLLAPSPPKLQTGSNIASRHSSYVNNSNNNQDDNTSTTDDAQGTTAANANRSAIRQRMLEQYEASRPVRGAPPAGVVNAKQGINGSNTCMVDDEAGGTAVVTGSVIEDDVPKTNVTAIGTKEQPKQSPPRQNDVDPVLNANPAPAPSNSSESIFAAITKQGRISQPFRPDLTPLQAYHHGVGGSRRTQQPSTIVQQNSFTAYCEAELFPDLHSQQTTHSENTTLEGRGDGSSNPSQSRHRSPQPARPPKSPLKPGTEAYTEWLKHINAKVQAHTVNSNS